MSNKMPGAGDAPLKMGYRSIAILSLCAFNFSGCHGGGRQSMMRPKIITSPLRSQSVVVNQGYETVQTPGAVVVEQQGGAAVTTQQAEPPITAVESGRGTSVTTVVPSFGDAQEPIGGGTPSTQPRLTPPANNLDSPRGVIDSLAPPAEAPQAIMEAPPVSNLDRPATSSAPPIDSTIKRPSSNGNAPEEPRLEVIDPPGKSSSGGGSGTSSPTNSSAPKTSAWRTSPEKSDLNRTRFQASTTRPKNQESYTLGVLD